MHRFWVALGAACLLPGRAEAHLVGVEFGEFYAGVLHLGTSPEHVGVLLALGFLAASQPRERARWMLAALPAGLLAGVLAGILSGPGVEIAALAPWIGASLVLAGGLGLLARTLPAAALAALAGAVGLLHGLANGLLGEETPIDWRLYAAGVVTAGTVIGTLAIAGATALADLAHWLRLGTRVLASWVTAVGAIFLGLALAGT